MKDIKQCGCKVAVYPGSFDPITCGHLDIITRAANVFDKVIVACLHNSAKKYTFDTETRVDFVKKATAHIPNVEVAFFSGLLVDYIRDNDIKIVVRGLRAISDFEYEFQMALTNKKLYDDFEMFFLATNAEYLYLSSSIAKEVTRYGADISGMVPDAIVDDVRNALRQDN